MICFNIKVIVTKDVPMSAQVQQSGTSAPLPAPSRSCIRSMRLLLEKPPQQCGQANALYRHVHAFLTIVNRHARRVLTFSCTHAADYTADEIAIIGLLGAANGGSLCEIRARASWLVRTDGVEDLIESANYLAALLLVSGQEIRPIRVIQPRHALQPLSVCSG